MPVAELFLSAFLQALFEKLMSPQLLKLAGQEGVRAKLKKWEETLKTIEAVLIDAEEKQLSDRAVKLWLDDLRDLAYDAEDILDEFAAEAGLRLLKKHEASSSTFRSLIQGFSSGASSIMAGISTRPKMEEISSRLEELCERRTDLGLEKIAGGSAHTAAVRQRPPTTCLTSEPAVYGRDTEKARVLDMVLKNDPCDAANFRVIALVGMGGIGKTTLAQEVYNDKRVEDFKPKAWVCVSDDFDVLRISKAILESITLSSCDLKDLNSVQLKLKEALLKKKFFIVLDDVWDKKYELWHALKSPFMAGAPGSRIIVTTRSRDVASKMGPVKYYGLKLLSDDDCWSVFVAHAFDSRDAGTHGNFESTRQRVVEKCKGLPLAARALGGLLGSKQRVDEWEAILDSKIWDLEDETEVPSVLKLSYHHLPSHLKRCFAYCAILPKDYEFQEEELVLLWIAEGLIQQSKDRKQADDLGSEYFHDLLSRSLFQKSSNSGSKFVMHDLVHDLAQWASGETCFRLDDQFSVDRQPNVFEKVRHSSYVRSGDCDGMGVRCDGMNKFKVLDKVENLRTFLPIFVEECFFSPAGYISPMVISDLLPKCKKLRVLSLGRYRISEVPTSIGCLKHLRYLNFSESWIKCLPEAITSLFNLEILILSDCRLLLKLPSSIGNLVNLYHLDIDGANRLCELPLGMKELKCLRTLTNFIVGKDSGCALKDLKNWKFLRGRLCISGLENVIDSQEANEALLRVKKDLEVLKLEWRARRDGDSVDEVREKNILDMLKPHGNIKRLVINSYGGTRFPSWIGDPSFSNVAVLILKNCRRSTSLPSLGQLCSLKDLTIVRMSALKGIGSEINGECCSKPFPSLQTLYFEDLQVWEKWEPNTENDEHVQAFPRLQKLFIHKCPKLSGRLPNHLPSLEKIVITECRQLVISLPSVPALCKLKIDGCKRLVCDGLSESKSLNKMTLWNISEFENWSSQKFQNVEHLEIVGCEGFVNEICLGKPLQGLHSLTCLKDLLIGNCPTFVSLPKACFLSNLRKITIEDCCALTSLTDGMIHNNVRLEVLRIKGCHSLTSISRGQLPSSLKSIDIRHCETLQCVLDDRENSCTSSSVLEKTINSSSTCLDLESLSVFRCPLLTCLWTGGWLPVTLKRLEIWCCYNFKVLTSECQLPVAIEELTISNCSNLESIAERFYDDACLRSILISSCDNLKSLPKGLNNLSHLHRISIEGCHNLVSLPEDALPSSVVDVSIEECDKLKGPLPTGKISSLQELSLKKCPGIVFFPEEGLSTNLTYLEISGANIYKPLVNWGFHKLTSLRKLCINGCSDAVSFPEVEKGVILPTSLTWIRISDFPKLERLSSKGFHYLVSLESLEVFSCPNFTSFPEAGFPSSLLSLKIIGCPLLGNKCRKDKGQEWPKIAYIPYVVIDPKFIRHQQEVA
ncbi:putative disease resistance protein [Citrus sinensis]|uniref:Disease resistance protein n=1 Tax=Citrus sinensis TaxID=2711 RepID=A0ACB8I384_CITSI|nr:putative disease resistance protein [Citrus sinensis]